MTNIYVDATNAADPNNSDYSGIERSYFDDLPSLAPTVLLSTRYNMGPNYKMNGGQHEALWNSLVDGNLPAAADALRAIGAAQKAPGIRNRRNAEADYLTKK